MDQSQAVTWVTPALVHGYQGYATAITTADMFTYLKPLLMIRNFHFVKLKYGDKKVSIIIIMMSNQYKLTSSWMSILLMLQSRVYDMHEYLSL